MNHTDFGQPPFDGPIVFALGSVRLLVANCKQCFKGLLDKVHVCFQGQTKGVQPLVREGFVITVSPKLGCRDRLNSHQQRYPVIVRCLGTGLQSPYK